MKLQGRCKGVARALQGCCNAIQPFRGRTSKILMTATMRHPKPKCYRPNPFVFNWFKGFFEITNPKDTSQHHRAGCAGRCAPRAGGWRCPELSRRRCPELSRRGWIKKQQKIRQGSAALHAALFVKCNAAKIWSWNLSSRPSKPKNHLMHCVLHPLPGFTLFF